MTRSNQPTNLTVVAAAATSGHDQISGIIESASALQQRGEYDRALARFEQALKLLRTQTYDSRTADVLRHIGSIHREHGDTNAAQEFYKESLFAAERISYTAGIAHALNWLAVIDVRRGDMTAAEAGFDQASAVASRAQDLKLLGMIEQNRGVLANIRGDIGNALLRYRSALGAFKRTNDLDSLAAVLNNIGLMETELRHWKEAEAAFGEARQAARETGNTAALNSIELNRAELAAARARWQGVEDRSRRAIKMARKRKDPVREAEALRFSAIAARERGTFDVAEQALLQAHALAADADDKLLQAQIARELGVLYTRTKRSAEARAAFMRSLELFGVVGAAMDQADVQDRLAQYTG